MHNSKIQVLVVDDDQAVCDIVSRMLERLGHLTTAVFSGQAAIDECQRGNFDLVLLDVDMPSLSGEEVYATLREDGQDLPVVFMTGYRTEEIASQLGGNAAVGFLAKPFQMTELRTTMDSMLSSVLQDVRPDMLAGEAQE